ncbi:MAG: accessory colonization factor [Candidatus Entotheonella gemina]|uniref:Accessory colonization factor n=1 Tax=Candidatus Entotheonella gemina TaxID=1429439 RepID=W4LTK4_9BACT|nr:MAG: accessory colonization factor [Candidatus Entotheonella gemina]
MSFSSTTHFLYRWAFTLAALALLVACTASAQTLKDPSITHAPKDGVIRAYGAGGPHTAYRRVAEIFEKETGIPVEIIAGPESKWTKDAQRQADIIWGTSEQSMTAFLETYTEFASAKVEPLYIRPAVIAVQKGNPKGIEGFDDLLKPGMRIVVTEGAGIYNTSGNGVWEDIAGRLGSLDDVKRFRDNIIAYAKGSGASFKAFKEQQADAWITWMHWPINHPDDADYVEFKPERKIWRDTNMVISPKADPQAVEFVEFLKNDRAAAIFRSEGWTR